MLFGYKYVLIILCKVNHLNNKKINKIINKKNA